MGYFTEEMEFLDLAPGEPISQDSQNRSYRYSQSLACPSAPYNSAESEYLEAQFGHFPSTSELSPIEETEGQLFHHDVPLISPDSTSSQRHSVHSFAFEGVLADSQLEGDRCNENSPEDIPALVGLASDDKDTTSSKEFQSPQNQPFDSLGQSVFEVIYGQKTIHGCSKTQIHCDPGLLEEETQIEDAVVTIPATENSKLCSGNLLKLTSRGDDAEDFAKSGMALQLIHAASKSPDSCAAQKPEKGSSIHTYKQEPRSATETKDDLDIVQRWHGRKRRPLSANTKVTSEYNTRTPGELREQADKFVKPGRLEAANLQQESEKENEDASKEYQSASTCIETTIPPEPTPSNRDPSAHPDVFCAGHHTEGCGESNGSVQMHQKRLREKDLKSFWQLQDDVRLEGEGTSEQGNVEEGGWLCPRSKRKYRVRVKQRSIEMWIR